MKKSIILLMLLTFSGASQAAYLDCVAKLYSKDSKTLTAERRFQVGINDAPKFDILTKDFKVEVGFEQDFNKPGHYIHPSVAVHEVTSYSLMTGDKIQKVLVVDSQPRGDVRVQYFSPGKEVNVKVICTNSRQNDEPAGSI